MFFIGILGTYIVIRSGWPHLFEQQGRTLNKLLAGINTLVLIFSSLTMALAVDAAKKGGGPKRLKSPAITFPCPVPFRGFKGVETTVKFPPKTTPAKEKA